MSDEETPYARVVRWQQEGVPRQSWFERLRAEGVDDESARVVVNAVDGANPPPLPEAALSQGVNPLAPNAFALGDLGMSGPPATVGMYWVGFGCALLVTAAAIWALVKLGLVSSAPSTVEVVIRVVGTIALLALARGLWQIVGALSIRRRP